MIEVYYSPLRDLNRSWRWLLGVRQKIWNRVLSLSGMHVYIFIYMYIYIIKWLIHKGLLISLTWQPPEAKLNKRERWHFYKSHCLLKMELNLTNYSHTYKPLSFPPPLFLPSPTPSVFFFRFSLSPNSRGTFSPASCILRHWNSNPNPIRSQPKTSLASNPTPK